MVLICPYCDIEISEKLVEAEDGCCPECGTLITANSVVDEYDEDEYDDEFSDEFDNEELEEEDEFGDIDFDDFDDDDKKSK